MKRTLFSFTLALILGGCHSAPKQQPVVSPTTPARNKLQAQADLLSDTVAWSNRGDQLLLDCSNADDKRWRKFNCEARKQKSLEEVKVLRQRMNELEKK